MTQELRNYVAAWVDYRRNEDRIVVLERDQDGKLFRKIYNPPYYFYVPDEDGDYESIFGHKLIRAEFDSKDEYNYAKNQFTLKFESDIAPIKRVLMDNYYGIPAPIVNYAFLDIEVDYSQAIGFAGPLNPYADINAISIYQSWTGKYLSFVIPPKGWSGSADDIFNTFNSLIKDNKLRKGIFPDITICTNEMELLVRMCDALSEADILSGWNSEFYDLPYICERLITNGGEHMLAKIDHLGARLPKKEVVNRFGSEEPIYKLSGKCHLDYMALFKKFTFEGRTSYSLGNILESEVGIGKLHYDKTLEHLYNNDFPLFVAYNFRDTDGLVQLDQKFKFIALVNQMAHENTVDFSAMLGTVSYVETGITNHAHNVLKKIVHDKTITINKKVEGAIVLTPTPAMHEWVGSVDINSLYPNVCRALNISPEMILGQFLDVNDAPDESAYLEIQHKSNKELTLRFEDGKTDSAHAVEWADILKYNKWAISAYGTVFDQSHGYGVIPDVFTYWITERKRLQAEKKKWTKIVKDLPEGTAEYKEAKRQEEHFDLLQLTKKISLNSAYGALLNPAFRFGDERMGASVTATGRAITTHMLYKIEELVTGIPKTYKKIVGVTEYSGTNEPYNKFHYITQAKQLEVLRKDKKLENMKQKLPNNFQDFQSIIYGDTDSAYFKTLATTKNEAVEIADLIAAEVNKSFPDFVRLAFNCQPGHDDFIKAGREVVAVRGLFQAKKKYMLKVVDLEGIAVNKMKSQGSEIKKADTPKIIQDFLKQTVDMILEGVIYDEVAAYVNQQRKTILKNKTNMFLIGVAKQVNNLDKFMAEYQNPGTITTENGRKLTIPGHVRAALNYNQLLDTFEKGAKAVRAGDKVLVYYLKPNTFGFDAVAFPAELTRFPSWFSEHFRVDIKKTESRMFDNKLEGIFSALGKDVPSPQSVLNNQILEF